jgi:hypothetical protein
MPDPLVAAFTEALTAPAGPIPAGFAGDYAVELAKLARNVLGRERLRALDRLERIADGLAKFDPLSYDGTHGARCMLCGAVETSEGHWVVHAPTCPWRLARDRPSCRPESTNG